MTDKVHPTAEKLMQTVSAMLDSEHPHEILVDEVLRVSGVNRGSLYHFFGDFPSLVRTTLLRRFSANVAADGEAMRAVAHTASSKEEYWAKIVELSALTQVAHRAPMRLERARLISLATSDDEFAQALASEQQRVTDALAEAITIAQERGWVDAQLNPQAIAVFLQAYSLGRSVDDVAERNISNDDWQQVVVRAISSFKSA